jgi:hypothetical protein
MTTGRDDLPAAWLRITKEQMQKLRSARAYAASPGELMGQIDTLIGCKVRQRGEDYYIELPPNYRTRSHWNASIDQVKIEEVFNEQQMAINVDNLKRMLEEHDEFLFRKTVEQEEEEERQSLREQLLAAQQEDEDE